MNLPVDCPACSLPKRTGALNCFSCGFDFHASEHNAFAEWPIELAYWQRFVVFWSISWPAWLPYLVLRIFPSGSNPVAFDLLPGLLFFGLQALLMSRMFRKDYDHFRICVIREGGQLQRTFPLRDLFPVWFRIAGAQLLYIVPSTVVGRIISGPSFSVSPPLIVFFYSLGPEAIHYAMRAKYHGFRLQAYRFK